jgi:hypothetical protein
MPIAIVKVHEALGENAPVLDQVKLPAAQRMERVRDAYSAKFMAGNGRNRRAIQTDDRSEDLPLAARRPKHRDR